MMHNRIAPLLMFGALVWAAPVTAQEMRPIVFDVWLPAGATLEIEGHKTTSTGEKRTFETPPVAVGKTYAYKVKVALGGKEVIKTLLLKTEGQQSIDLRASFQSAAEPIKSPKPAPIKGPTKPGYITYIEDGRLWVFRDGSKEVAAFLMDGELAKHVVRPGIGPKGMTIKGPDAETVVEFLLTQDGFETVLEKDGGRVWVFKKGSKEFVAFKKDGELAKHIVRIKAGPMGMTIKAADAETIDAYMKAYKK
jgi:uncharacterized protein (TIGR03000 family)